MNELLFLLHSTFIAGIALAAAYLGREALTAFVAISCILANLFVIKQITLFGMQVTATDAYIIGSILAMNLLNEYFGKESAKKALWIAFSAAALFAVLAQLHLTYIPNRFDESHLLFVQIFNATPRIILASLFSYFISQRFENYFYTFLKDQFNGNYLIVRNYLSMSCSQLVDTILFSFLGLYGIVENVFDIIVVSYIIKLIAIIIVSPLIWLSKFYMKCNVHETV